MNTRPRGIAMVVCLLVLVLVLLFAQAMGTLGIQHLNLVDADFHDRVSAYAAEAGAARALHELQASSLWTAGWVDEPLTPSNRSTYTVQVTSGMLSATAVTAPDGASVPPKHVYLLSTGHCLDGRHPRRTAIMLAPGYWLPYAVLSSGNLTLGGAAQITGSVRSGGDIDFGGRVVVTPDSSGGRVLSGGNLVLGSVLSMDPSQDVRARGIIDRLTDVRGTTQVHPQDTTSDTAPLTTLLPFPVPDRAALLAGAVEHPGVTSFGQGETLDLAGQTHYFPEGVRFQPGSSVTGSGNLVVGNGQAMVFEAPFDLQANLVAFDSQGGVAGDALVEFNALGRIQGVVFCEGDIRTAAAVDVTGGIFAFSGGSVVQDLKNHASLQVVRARPVVPLPGFEDFVGGGVGGLSIRSWQRY